MLAVSRNLSKTLKPTSTEAKPKFNPNPLICEESKLIKECTTDLVKEINTSCKKPYDLILDIFNQLIDCLLKHEEIEQKIKSSFPAEKNEELERLKINVEKNIAKKYLIVNIIKRINFKKPDEKYNHFLASKKTREKIKLLLMEKFLPDQELANYYNDKFEKILRSKNMLT